MTKLQKLQLEQSEKRERLHALLDKPTAGEGALTDAERAELSTTARRLQALEPELRAALVADAEAADEANGEAANGSASALDAEHRERLELRAKARLSGYFAAAMTGRQVAGAEAEYAAAERVAGIPLALFDPDPRRAPEQRADAATAAPATGGVNLQPIRPAVFATSILPRLGVEMPRVESGSYAEARISTSLGAAAEGKGDAAESTAAVFAVSSTAPKRISARLTVRAEDVAAVGADNFEAALRQNLRLALGDELDKQGLSGDGTGDNLTGLLQRLADPVAPTAVSTWESFNAQLADLVDGLWAQTGADVVAVVGPATYRHAAVTFQSTNTVKGERSASAYLRENYGGWWTNSRMPAAAANIQQAVAYRMGQPGIRTAVLPHWGEMNIDDVYSGSASAERHLTIHVLAGDVLLVQPDAYKQIGFKLA